MSIQHNGDRYVDTDCKDEEVGDEDCVCEGEHIADIEGEYDAFLDEVCEMVKIGTLEYYPSRVFSEVDPIAYRCGFSDWLDSEISSGAIVEYEGEYYRT